MSMTAARSFHISPDADDDRGEDQGGDTCHDEAEGFFAGALPFVEEPSPHRAENDDARHVQSP